MNKKRKKKKIAFQEVQIFQVKEYHNKEGYIEKIFQSSKKYHTRNWLYVESTNTTFPNILFHLIHISIYFNLYLQLMPIFLQF